MRLTPAQLAVHMICGRVLPDAPAELEVRLRLGRDLLRDMTGVDFGYDLQKWHDHLKVTRDGGYTWNRSVELPRIMKEALASVEWLNAVAQGATTSRKKRRKALTLAERLRPGAHKVESRGPGAEYGRSTSTSAPRSSSSAIKKSGA